MTNREFWQQAFLISLKENLKRNCTPSSAVKTATQIACDAEKELQTFAPKEQEQ